MDLSAAYGMQIPFQGYTKVEFTLSPNVLAGMSDKPVVVLILAVTTKLKRPIIGFNIIEELALTSKESQHCFLPRHMVKRLNSALEVGQKTARGVLTVLNPHIACTGRISITVTN